MRPFSPRFSLRFRLGVPCALFAAACLLGACDKHSATEVPESYGHGSSHQRNYENHQIDSTNGTKSFSDTHGINTDGKNDEHKATPAESPSASQPGRFFPNG